MNQPVHIKNGVNYSGYNINGGETEDTNFEGTLEAFNALPEEEKAKYKTRDLRGDFNGMPIDADLDSSSNHPVENQAIAKNIEAVVNVYGSKNLLPNGFTSQVVNGVTFTVNSDGSITANGTCNSNNGSYLELDFAKCNLTKGAEYIVSGCPTGGSENTYCITIAGNWGGQAGQRLARDIGEEAVFTYPTHSATNERIYIVAANANGQQVNLTFHPMIRDARITDPTYVPYAMTNRELTEKVLNADCKVYPLKRSSVTTISLYNTAGFLFINETNDKYGVYYHSNTNVVTVAGNATVQISKSDELTISITNPRTWELYLWSMEYHV